MKGISRRTRACAAVAGLAIFASATTAQAQTRPEKLGEGVPTGQMGVQMFNYGNFISSGGNAGTPFPFTIPAAADGTQCNTNVLPNPNANPPVVGDPPALIAECRSKRLEALFAFLQKKGVTNIEIFGHAGFPASTDIPGLTAYRALMDKYGLHAGGWHGTMNDVGPGWTERLAAARILGMEYIGSGGVPSPGVGSENTPERVGYDMVLKTAEAWNRLGKEAVEAGVGPAYIHNHTGEFDRKYYDNGVLKTAWQILVERTDPRYAVVEIDAFWAQDAFNDESGQATANLINQFPTRVKLLHMKDGINITSQPSPTNSRGGSPRAWGTGVIDWRPILTAARDRVQYYHQEQDGGTIADAETSFTNMKGVGANSKAALLGLPQSFAAVPAGTNPAGNTQAVVIQNTGDKDLNITNTTLTGEDAADFQVVSSTCGRYPGQPNNTPGVTLAPGNVAAGVARGTCTVNVGFKPTTTNKKSVAYLTLASNADNATENILLTGQSTGTSVVTAGGTVDSVLGLGILGTGVSFGTFQPGVARNYDTSLSANVVSTAGNAALTVVDSTTTAPGKLVNGAFALAQPLQIRADKGQAGAAFTPLSGTSNTPTTLLTYDAPSLGSEAVTLAFRQAIGNADQLRAGTYQKSLTFTLSTTQP